MSYWQRIGLLVTLVVGTLGCAAQVEPTDRTRVDPAAVIGLSEGVAYERLGVDGFWTQASTFHSAYVDVRSRFLPDRTLTLVLATNAAGDWVVYSCGVRPREPKDVFDPWPPKIATTGQAGPPKPIKMRPIPVTRLDQQGAPGPATAPAPRTE